MKELTLKMVAPGLLEFTRPVILEQTQTTRRSFHGSLACDDDGIWEVRGTIMVERKGKDGWRPEEGASLSKLKGGDQTLTASLGETVEKAKAEKKREQRFQKTLELDSEIQQVVAGNPGLPKSDVVKRVGGRAETTSKRIDGLIESGFIQTQKKPGKGQALLLFPPASDADYLLDKVKGVAA